MGLTGGLKLKKRKETGFTAIYNMLNLPGSTLELLTYSSLKGFMFTVTVAKGEDGGYLDYDGNKFKKDVTRYLLKIAVLSSNNDDYMPSYKNVTKRTESEKSYFDEAVMQQTIWKRSITTGGKTPLCPPVANFSTFGNRDSRYLLHFLISKASSPETKGVLDYLYSDCIISSKSLSTGIIVMPMISNSKTFSDYEDSRGLIARTTRRKLDVVLDDAYIDATAEMIRLFIDIGVLHFDAHMGNVLVYTTTTIDTPKCVVIDFGRASNIMNDDVNDEYLNTKEKKEVRAKKDAFYNRFLQGADKKFDKKFDKKNDKKNFIKEVCEYYRSTDYTKNEKMFGSELEDAESSWLWTYVEDQPDEFLEKVYDKLREIITVTDETGIQAATITRLEKEGRFFNINGKLKDFKVFFPRHLTTSTTTTTTRKRKRKNNSSSSSSKSKSKSKSKSSRSL